MTEREIRAVLRAALNDCQAELRGAAEEQKAEARDYRLDQLAAKLARAVAALDAGPPGPRRPRPSGG